MKGYLRLQMLIALVIVSALAAAIGAERSEVPAKYKWKTSDLFATEDSWFKSKDDIAARIPKLADFRGKLGASADSFYAARFRPHGPGPRPLAPFDLRLDAFGRGHPCRQDPRDEAGRGGFGSQVRRLRGIFPPGDHCYGRGQGEGICRLRQAPGALCPLAGRHLALCAAHPFGARGEGRGRGRDHGRRPFQRLQHLHQRRPALSRGHAQIGREGAPRRPRPTPSTAPRRTATTAT